MSADDLLYGSIVTTTEQNVWLNSYIEAWDSLENCVMLSNT